MDAFNKASAFLFSHFDKLAHYAGGGPISVVSLVVGYFVYPAFACHFSILFTIIALWLKEVWDSRNPPHQFEYFDLFWGVMGGVPVWLAYIVGRAS